MLRKNKHDATPIVPIDTDINRRIMQTLESLQLDPQEVMLVGSAALTLHGVELLPYSAPGEHPSRALVRPTDIDLASTASYMERVNSVGTPSGFRFSRKPTEQAYNAQTILRSVGGYEAPTMPVELITRFRENRDDIARYDRKFRERIQNAGRPLGDTALRIISLEAAAKDISAAARYEPKAQQDLTAIRQHLAKSR